MHESAGALTSAETVVAAPVDSRSLSGRILLLTRLVWTVIAVGILVLAITAFPIRYEKVRSVAPNLRVPEFRDLISVGVSPEKAAAADITALAIVFLLAYGGGVLFYLRGSRSREVTLLSLTLMLYVTAFSGLTSAHRTSGPPFSQSLPGLLATIHYFLGTSTGYVALFWLPQGQFRSRWTAWFTALLVLAFGTLYFFVSFPRAHDLINIVGLPAAVVGGCVQVFHYRRTFSPVARQQIKWAVIGIVAAVMGFVIVQTATLLLQDQPGLMPRIGMITARLVVITSQAAIPVCFAIAVLRYRLWQIDLVINRSLVYGTVTALLVLVFVGGGLVVQTILGEGQSPIAFAISTAGAGLLFSPARKYVQRFVDRRLYGLRFDLGELNRAQRIPSVKSPGALTGRTLGRYRVLDVIGRGGMGEVYRGESDGRMFALKILPRELDRTDFPKWFARESQALAAVSHPNIVRFHGSGQSDGMFYLVLDLIQGRELGDILRERQRIPLDEVQQVVRDLADALDYVHEQGLVHRDIKPSNVMIRRKANGTEPEAVLMDFGIAKINDARTALTRTGAVGTISYMAPEQITASLAIDRRADIYALGVTVYEMLTGELPFSGSPAHVLFAQLQERPRDLRELLPELPTNVARGVMRALEKDPKDRFDSAGEFAAAVYA